MRSHSFVIVLAIVTLVLSAAIAVQAQPVPQTVVPPSLAASATCTTPTPTWPTPGANIPYTDNVIFTWTGACAQYKVEYRGPQVGEGSSAWVSTTSWNARDWSPSGSRGLGPVRWRVKGRDAAGVETDWSPWIEFSLVLKAPTGLKAQVWNFSEIYLTWTASSGWVRGYYICIGGQHYAGSDGPGYVVQNLQPGTTYTITVTAYDIFLGESAPSNVVTATTRDASCLDRYEPNDTWDNPCYFWTSASSGPTVFHSYICCLPSGRDVDYHRIWVDAGNRIELRLSDLPANYDLCLYAPNHSLIRCSANSSGDEYISRLATSSGIYFAKVYGYGNACDSAHPYTLTIAVTGPTPVPTRTPTPGPVPTPTPGGAVITRTLQQGLDGYGGCADTYLYQYEPQTMYRAAQTLKVGYKQQNAALLYFDLSPMPPNAVITHAALQVYGTGWSGVNLPFGAHAVLRPCAPFFATWEWADSGVRWDLPGCNNTSTDRRATPESTVTANGILRWFNLDLTQLVQSWYLGNQPNYGLLLRATSTAAYSYFLASADHVNPALRPKLVLTYWVTP